MASNSLAASIRPVVRAPMTLEEIDRATELLIKAQGIVSVVGSASTSDERPNDDAIRHSCWAIHEMLAEVRTIVEKTTGERS